MTPQSEPDAANMSGIAAVPSITDNSSASAPGTMTSPLLTLPPELRNRIWEYTLSPCSYQGEKTDLLNTIPPSNDLLLTCSQIRQEASGYVEQSKLQYWRDTSFVMPFDEGQFEDVLEAIEKLEDEDLDNIVDITIRHTHEQHEYTANFLKWAQAWRVHGDIDDRRWGITSIVSVGAKGLCLCTELCREINREVGDTKAFGAFSARFAVLAREYHINLQEPASMKRQLLWWVRYLQTRDRYKSSGMEDAKTENTGWLDFRSG